MTTQIKAGVIAANAITATELASSALSGGSFTGDVTFDTNTLVVDSTNNRVGVGTASPNYPLEIQGTGTVTLAYQRTGVSAKKWGFHSDNDNTYWQNITDNVLGFTLSNAGNVGIGTTSPSQLLHLGGATNKGIQITTATSNAGYLAVYQDESIFGVNRDPSDGSFADTGKTAQFISLQSANGDGWIKFATTSTNNTEPTERVRITGAGNVGIGTSSPATKLHVEDSSGNVYIQSKRATQSQGQVAISLAGGTGGTDWIFYQQTSSNDLRIFGNSGDRMTLTSSGNVGIGTSSPGAKLEVYGTADSSPQTSGGIFKINSTATNAITFGTLNSSPFGCYIQSGGSGVYPLVLNPNGAAVTVGTTSTSALKMHIKDDTASTTPIMIVENVTSTVSTASVLLDLKFSGDDSFSNCDYIKFQDSSGEEGVITGDGGGRVYYEITSDYRKKENIVDYTGGLNVINNLSVKNYNMITNPNITYTGFIAHEVQEVVDGVARGVKDAVDDEGNPIYQGLDMSKLVPHLVSAIQEQQTIIDALQARLDAAGL